MIRRAVVLTSLIILQGCSSDTTPQQQAQPIGGSLDGGVDQAALQSDTGSGTVIDMPATDGPMPSCTDGIQNGDESDVDCGGFCSPCTLTKICRAHSDCASVHCIDTKCRECAPGTNQCVGNKSSACVDNMWVVANDDCPSSCDLNTGMCITGSE